MEPSDIDNLDDWVLDHHERLKVAAEAAGAPLRMRHGDANVSMTRSHALHLSDRRIEYC